MRTMGGRGLVNVMVDRCRCCAVVWANWYRGKMSRLGVDNACSRVCSLCRQRSMVNVEFKFV